MTGIPSKIHSYNVYDDNHSGRLYGTGEECTLPDFEALSETLSGAGILGELDDPAPGHFGNMQMEIPFRLLDGEAVDLMDPTSAARLTLRGAQQVLTAEGEYRVPVHAGGGPGQVRHPQDRHGQSRCGHGFRRHPEPLLHQN